ncbi:MAG: hypothetical protein HUJ93_04190, partial [Bacteroidales bacterium]|nr:hypothetical protein [Bacteroidales bacterium]
QQLPVMEQDTFCNEINERAYTRYNHSAVASIIAGSVLVGEGALLTALGVYAMSGAKKTNNSVLAIFGILYGAAGVSFGTIATLAGVPVLATGLSMRANPTYGELLPMRGLTWMTEAEGGLLPYQFGIKMGLGYNFSTHSYLGCGVGYSWSEVAEDYFPIYADFRYTFNEKKWSPYAGLQAGMEINPVDGGTYICPWSSVTFGMRCRIRKAARNSSLWMGLTAEGEYPEMETAMVGLRFGYSF